MIHKSYSIRNECQEEMMHIDCSGGWLHLTNPKLQMVTQLDTVPDPVTGVSAVLNELKFPFSMVDELIKTLEEIKGIPDSLI